MFFQPWSKKNDVLDKRRDKKQRRAEKRAASAQVPSSKDDNEEEEEDDFEAEYKMLKKLKQGKVSSAEFDAAINLNDLQSDEEG